MVKLAVRQRPWLFGAVAVLALALWVTAIPAPFTVDDCNYLSSVAALRHGGVTVPGTRGLTPSRALVPFDPLARKRVIDRSPVSPTVPPLYAPFGLLAWPLGWRGLVLINALSYAIIGWLVFGLAQRFTTQRHAPWVAAVAFLLGGYSFDYAQGLWPHMLSAALTTAAVWFSIRAHDDGQARWAAVAGLLVGLAAGVRYQNVVLATALLLTLLLWSRRRWRTGLACAAGLAVPLACSSIINAVRLGSFNPVSKGASYVASSAGRSGLHPLVDSLTTLWVRIVDYSAHPPFAGEVGRMALPKHPETGVFVVLGGLKKALLQSAPWAVVAFIVLMMAWLPWPAIPKSRRRPLRLLSLLVAAVLALFAWAGLERTDGWGFNQRYLIEIVPLLAVALGLAVDDWKLDRAALVLGTALGVATAAVPLALAPEQAFRQRMIMYAPLVLAMSLAICWWVAKRHPWVARLRAGLLAGCVGWALAVHVGDDMSSARARRDILLFQYQEIAQGIPDEPVALFAYPGQKLGTCGLYFDRDIVILDTFADQGEAASQLTGELLDARRRVFVLNGTPQPILRSIVHDRGFRLVKGRPIAIGEVLSGEAADGGSGAPSSSPKGFR